MELDSNLDKFLLFIKRQIIFLLILLLFGCSCANNNTGKDIVLKIGKLEITKFEFEKNKYRDLVKNGSDSSDFKDLNKVKGWKHNYLDKCFIVADAYDKKFDTLSIIKNSVKYTGNYMMVQQYGYLWENLISPVVNKRKAMTQEKIQKRKRLYCFECISFDKNEFAKDPLFSNDSLKSYTDFQSLKIKYASLKTFTSKKLEIRWPFLNYWDNKEYLFSMKKGEVSKPLFRDNQLAFLYLDHIEEKSVLSDMEKNSAAIELQIGTEDELIKKSDHEVDSVCKPVLNEISIDEIAKFLENGNSIFQYKNNPEVITYRMGNLNKRIKFKTFVEYYSFLPIRAQIKDKESLSIAIRGFCDDDYLISKATKLKLFELDSFKLDQKNYQNNILYGYCLDKEIISKIKIDSVEVVNYYYNNIRKFEQPKKVEISIYEFKTREAALRNRRVILESFDNIKMSNSQDFKQIEGMTKYSRNIIVDMESQDYSKEIKSSILKTGVKMLSQSPIFYDGAYILIFKENETGICSRKFSDVYNTIFNILKDERIEEKRIDLVSKLKNKYKIELDKTGI